MKKLIVAFVAAGFISLGFTLVNQPEKKVALKIQKSEKMDFSNQLNEKRLASWD